MRFRVSEAIPDEVSPVLQAHDSQGRVLLLPYFHLSILNIFFAKMPATATVVDVFAKITLAMYKTLKMLHHFVIFLSNIFLVFMD